MPSYTVELPDDKYEINSELVDECIHLLKQINADASIFAQLSEEQRVSLFKEAGFFFKTFT